jgi:glycosyltransferase involved in cell wall biosynthesis
MMKPESQPLVSVLTPVYNGEKYLAECIESVLAQTYQNWDYCIVNNCSTDRTLEIAQSYANRDKRIRIHNNTTFVGCDENGNIAFQQISKDSKYCKMVHADDWLFPECIMKMVEVAEANPTVAIVSAYRLSNIEVSFHALPYETQVLSGREICRQTLLGIVKGSVFGSPTSMLISADEIRKRPAFYNVANPHCDMEACLDILKDRNFGFVHQILTFSREHPDSETTFGSRFGTSYLARLEHMTKYGRVYLNEEEYEAAIKKRSDSYYAFLGSRMFRHNDHAFWEFHRNGLHRLGLTLNAGSLAKAAAGELLNLALNPLDTARRIVRRNKMT